MKTVLVYRGPLAGCNYACGYCPFARQAAGPENLQEDRQATARFVGWLAQCGLSDMGVQFTPRGEALIRPWRQDAVVDISRIPSVSKVAIQTNLSCDLSWLERCDLSRVGLWCTYHPRQVSRQNFLDQCRTLDRLGVRYSVGVVGLREQFGEIAAMRAHLPRRVYLWINAFKSQGPYYEPGEIRDLTKIDPLFSLSTHRHASKGKPCQCGQNIFAVDGDGTVRRCHFVSGAIGNLYTDDLAQLATPQPCPNETCGCHIGYIHMPELNGPELFGDGILERIPRSQV
ncbi:MAG: STM4011 family radical SAM protein [Phycisphaerae bacterium]|jgi:hypothetical protein|nr:STM4011 family radical SAM protein [Phycisphaerae bacterium]MDP7286554.1 STM4011 family radical SAM protein [Phycisphaerae bacterium]